ncbi:MAG: cobalt-precorrin-5B (C(1))-methyltransferase CbiD [Eubacterium sp.]
MTERQDFQMEDFIVKDGKKLRLGYTTGSCAAAASKAACLMLLTGVRLDKVSLVAPNGKNLCIDILDIRRDEDSVSCAVRKDGGDDPDVTDGTLVYARVSRTAQAGVLIEGGRGVGRVTKPGLDQPVGEAAINSVPRKMIKENIKEACSAADYHGGIRVVISVPEGEELAKRTFNPRLGIVGGISIIGTTGIVEPMSEKALVETIKVELRQKKLSGKKYVLLTPGNYGSSFIGSAIGIDPENAVTTSNFIGDSLDMCAEMGFDGALLVGHIGKLVKIAGGMLNTHSKYGDCRMEIIAAHAGACGLGSEKIEEILGSVTCDESIRILDEAGLREAVMARIIDRIAFIMDNRVMGKIKTGAIVFSNEYGLLGETAGARPLLDSIAGEIKASPEK